MFFRGSVEKASSWRWMKLQSRRSPERGGMAQAACRTLARGRLTAALPAARPLLGLT